MSDALKDIEKMFGFGDKPTIGDSVGESIRKMEALIKKEKESK